VLALNAGCNSASQFEFTVGGTVSGLTSDGLVLANGGKSLGVANGATHFSFSAVWPPNSSYSVTVQSQPLGQTCTIANGSGAAGTAATNITVTCVNLAFSLGGTVSGLTSDGLFLTDGNSTLDVARDATSFSFGEVLESDSSYSVDVQTQPAGQTCSVANGSGAAAGANVGNVVVTCADQSFSLGGTVSGLVTDGLTLGNGSDTLDVPAGATTFTLPTAVAFSSSYAVTVAAQPPGLACNIANGTGTMPASAVTNVAVSCTSQPFSLGGSIAGLTSSGLMLANGGDTLTVESSATSFTMPTAVPFGSSYDVQVLSQPTGQTCAVSNASGSVPANDVTNVTVACANQTYALGGSIAGLTSSGLVLANGGDTHTVTSGATTFTMPAAVPYAASYGVTVQAQPTGLTCTVSDGTGIMPATAVTNVGITCAVNTYTLGGSITGLTAGGLVLANGADTLTVANNATSFTMPEGLAHGSSYSVTVQTQPVGLFCGITNASGTITSNVDSVQVSCALSTMSFTTPGATTWVVPAGVSAIEVAATGGGGGAGDIGDTFHGTGGNGGIVTVTLAVSPGDVLDLVVGGGGGSIRTAYAGGGGGGSSNVTVNSTVVIVAGGGGGGGGGPQEGNGGHGAGAGITGADGTPGQHPSTPSLGGAGGAGGIGGAGGAGGTTASTAGGSGTGGAGGAGHGAGGSGSGPGPGGTGAYYLSSHPNGGGGGGGYGGAGGGGTDDFGQGAGGGGGGSLGPKGSVVSVAANGSAEGGIAGGNGSIVISFP
jgi:hypothetical protein